MARVRIQAQVTDAASSTVPLFGTETSAPAVTNAPAVVSDPMGIKHVKCRCGLDVSIGILEQNKGLCPSCKTNPIREQEIRDHQNEAIAKTRADAADPEREAIQAEAKAAEERLAKEKADELKKQLEAKVKADAAIEVDRIRDDIFAGAFFSPSNPPANPLVEPSKVISPVGHTSTAFVEYVDAVWGMEKYNRQGTFSSFEVGPFGGRTAIRPGETRQQAHDRLYEELRVMAHKERDRKHEEFVAQFLKVQKV